MAGHRVQVGVVDLAAVEMTEDEFTLLEENILSDGAVFSPLIVWDGTIACRWCG